MEHAVLAGRIAVPCVMLDTGLANEASRFRLALSVRLSLQSPVQRSGPRDRASHRNAHTDTRLADVDHR